ncbi:MAG: tetratricopeptide repeat protein [Cyanobacteria bacterium SZAS TMP-1]|nr:tetratricopeptide repeat protein [Cyanobacteria bacterium SZAS TMP-1]
MTLFFVGAIALVLTPGVMVFCQDAGLRQQMCENMHSLAGTVSVESGKIFKRMTARQGHSGSADSVGVAKFSSGTALSGLSAAGSGAGAGATGNAGPGDGSSVNLADDKQNSGNNESSQADMANNVSMVDQAVSVLTAQIAKDPNNPSLHNRLGLIYASVGELRRAESQFNQAIDLSREQLAQLNNELNTKKANGEIAQASQIMLTANQMELELSSAHSNLARVFEKLGQQSKVVAQLDQLNKDVIIASGPSQAVAVAPAVVARVASKSALAAASGNVKKVSPQLVANVAKAQALIQAGRPNEAVVQLKAALAIDPDLAEAHEELGKISLSSGNVPQAIEELTRACALNPGKASVHAALGVAYQYKGRQKEAIAQFNRAIALDSKDASSLFNLGNAYAAGGQNSEAMASYKKAVAIDPNMAVAHNNMGSLYALNNNNTAAIKEFEAALAQAPGMASAHYGLGLALYRSQDYAAASREFKAAVTLNPSLVDAHHKIAMCEKQSGRLPRQRLFQHVAMR